MAGHDVMAAFPTGELPSSILMTSGLAPAICLGVIMFAFLEDAEAEVCCGTDGEDSYTSDGSKHGLSF